jgi:type III pantothenate kinase
MLLADIGNTRIHIYNGKEVIHLSHQEAIREYRDQELRYITVKQQLKEQLNSLKNWEDISDKIKIKNEYSTMGIDRKALCLSHRNGIFVSAGTAITVDVVEKGIYMGGFLLLGLKAYIDAYATISPALKTQLDGDIELDKLPIGTKVGINYGIIASIKSLIEKHKGEKQLYISGGDGELLSSFFKGAIFDERLIFFGMQRSLELHY